MDKNIAQFLPIIAFIVLIYFFLIRPQKKKDKEIKAMRSGLGVGDEIITIGGIKGKIVKVKDESFVLQVGADKVKFEMMRWAVSKVVTSKGNAKDPSEEAPAAPKKAPRRLNKKDQSAEKEEVKDTPETDEAK